MKDVRPVIEVPNTILTAYRYVVNHRVTVARTGFVLFVYVVATSLVTALVPAPVSPDSMPQLTVLLIFPLVGALVSVATATSLTTAILWDLKPSTLFAIRIGRIELKVFAVSIALVALNTLAGAMAVLVQADPQNNAPLVLMGLAVASLTAFLWTRLSLMVPYAIAAGRFDLRGSWELTKGNFWPLVLVFLLAFLPLLFVVGAADALVERMRLNYAGNDFALFAVAIFSAGLNAVFQVFTVGLATALACFAFLTLAPRPIDIGRQAANDQANQT